MLRGLEQVSSEIKKKISNDSSPLAGRDHSATFPEMLYVVAYLIPPISPQIAIRDKEKHSELLSCLGSFSKNPNKPQLIPLFAPSTLNYMLVHPAKPHLKTL